MNFKESVTFVYLVIFMQLESSRTGLLETISIAGPVDIIIRKFASCPRKISGENGWRYTNIVAYHPKGQLSMFIMSANITLDFPLDDNILAAINVASWTKRGGWKSGSNSLNFHQMCTSFDTYSPNMWRPFVAKIYGRSDVRCPLPPIKNHFVPNMTFVSKELIAKEFIYGKWRVDMQFINEPTGKIRGCIRFECDTVPAGSADTGQS